MADKAIPAPVQPIEPVYEDLTSIPDQAHDWTGGWEDGNHYGRSCAACYAMSGCAGCGDADFDALDCLRKQAGNRNMRLRGDYHKALDRYSAQMDYYRTISVVGAQTGAILQIAFWEALKRCESDDRVHAMDYPYNSDPVIDGRLPDVLWEHMETALAELRKAAGAL